MDNKEFAQHLIDNRHLIASLMLQTPKIWGDPKKFENNNNVAINDLLINTRSGRVVIAENCFFGHGCALLTGTHDPHKFGERRLLDVPPEGRDIILKEGVWLASFVTVIGPAILGKNTAVAAGSLVIGDTEPNSLYAGRPAVKIRQLDGCGE